tara:strand:- start:902 stop:1336 length:435 start_codon:yes stop_codon:yes gene_type:complete
MVRARNLEETLDFYCDKLGLIETRRYENEPGRFTLIFLATPEDAQASNNKRVGAVIPSIEITWNWDDQIYDEGRNFGHVAYQVDDIYAFCQRLIERGVTINRPPRDGRMAFVKSPDGISIELLQNGEPLPRREPWVSMENVGSW